MIAALPMYDWPEVAAATDRLWAAIRAALAAEGVQAPERLTRGQDLMAGWTHPQLVLGQTCGLPLLRELAGRVTLLGAADYGVPGCPPGWYRSAVVVRADDPRTDLAAYRGARLAVNGYDSQSGWGSILHHVAPLGSAGFFGEILITGAHVASVTSVADGAADIAAIDFVSWRLAQRFRRESRLLRVLTLTDPTPGLPLIAALGTEPEPHRRALTAALAGLDRATRDELGIGGFVPLATADYALIGERIAAAGMPVAAA